MANRRGLNNVNKHSQVNAVMFTVGFNFALTLDIMLHKPFLLFCANSLLEPPRDRFLSCTCDDLCDKLEWRNWWLDCVFIL